MNVKMHQRREQPVKPAETKDSNKAKSEAKKQTPTRSTKSPRDVKKKNQEKTATDAKSVSTKAPGSQKQIAKKIAKRGSGEQAKYPAAEEGTLLAEAQRMMEEAARNPEEQPQGDEKSSKSPWRMLRWRRREEIAEDRDQEEEVVLSEYWIEVLLLKSDEGPMKWQWTHVDVINASVDDPLMYSKAGQTFSYVVGMYDRAVDDVTRRYVQDWHAVTQTRSLSDWWDTTLKKLTVLVKGHEYLAERENQQVRDEAREMHEVHLQEPLPRSLIAYKNHPAYCIEKHLGKYECIYPRKPVVGLVQGHAVYRRDCIQKLMSKEKWFRNIPPRVVRPTEIDVPAKTIERSERKRRLSKKSKKAEEESGTDDKLEGEEEDAESKKKIALYGQWQTDIYCPPPVVDGIIPKNDHGNWELWTEQHLPPGSVHINSTGILQLVRQFGINHAKALVGFEARAGTSYPVFDGVIVAKEHEELLRSAAEQQQANEDKLMEERRKQAALHNWKSLAKFLFTREEVQQRFDKQYTRKREEDQDETSRPLKRPKQKAKGKRNTETIG